MTMTVTITVTITIQVTSTMTSAPVVIEEGSSPPPFTSASPWSQPPPYRP